MSKLAYFGGKPIVKNLLTCSQFVWRRDLERKYLLETYDSGIWQDSPGRSDSMAAKFGREWAEFNKSKFCALLTNGTHTLQVALESLNIGVGDEVIVPGLTWQATASAVCDVNATPILVDIDENTLCIDTKKIEAAITPRTRAVIPVHLYHRMADMDEILRIARKHRLYVIEDCAHVHGSQWNQKGAGTLGVFGSYSFERSKLVNCGEGGALLMQKENLYWRVVSQRMCGREYKGVKIHSGNYRITSFQAAILRGQLAAYRKLAPVIDRHGLALDRAVAAAPGVRPLYRSPHITRQCSYCFVFLFESDAFDGLDCRTFREALSVELGVKFYSTYEPLHHSNLYYPHTKQRHNLNSRYRQAITPSRWHLPVVDDIWKNKAVVIGWKFLACPPDRAYHLTDAIAKIHKYRHELLRKGRKEGKNR